MKTIFITIHDGEVAKNIFRTDVWGILKKQADLKFVLLSSPEKKEYYEKQFGGENVIVEKFEPLKLSFVQRAAHAFFTHFLPVSTEKINEENLIVKNRDDIAKYSIFKIIYLLSYVKFLRRLTQRAGIHLLAQVSLKDLFLRYEPSLVFVTNILSYQDMNLMLEAKVYGVKTLSMVKSWDTSSTKGLIRVLPDHLIAPNEFSKKDMLDLHNFPEESKIFVSGFPNYDSYFKKEGLISREEFFSSMGLDLSKKLIFYCAIGDWLFPNEHEIVEMVDDGISEGKILNAQILARPHPKYRGIDDKLKDSKNAVMDRGATYPTSQVEGWEFEQKDIHHLINSIYHSDVLVTTASTMTIEACIFDKPVINIAFDGRSQLPEELSVSRYYNQHHYKPITDSGGARIVRGESELINAINEYLKNPEIDREARKKVIDMECHYNDGKSGERMAEFILKIIND